MMLICTLLLLFFTRSCYSLNFIASGQTLKDGSYLVSSGLTFELGFFSPGKLETRYIGIWYKNISPLTVVWVANRETPLYDKRGVLKLYDDGVLVLYNSTKNIVWYSNSNGVRTEKKPFAAELLDTGNLVVRNGVRNGSIEEKFFVWQSFDYPCDTLLPGMKLGWDLVNGLNRFISSWKSVDDPGVGEHVMQIDTKGYPQSVQLKGNSVRYRAGSWNGLYLTGFPVQKVNPIYNSEFVFNEKEVYYKYEVKDKSILSRIVLNPSGYGKRFVWRGENHEWEIISSNMVDQCDNYALCGAYSICNFGSSHVCSCLKGFVPRNSQEWNMSYWCNGCVRGSALECDSNDGFKKYEGMKLPDTSFSQVNKTMSFEECRQTCLRNCSCTAYASLDIRDGGSGCLLWFHDLIDMKQLHGGQALYVRVSASDLDYAEIGGHGNINMKELVGITVGSFILNMGMILIIFGLCVWRRKLQKPGITNIFSKNNYYNKLKKEDLDLQTFDWSVIAKATDNFSSSNKLGEGGFGSVHKGVLIDGQEIAVKRLSMNSCQGFDELKNEAVLIAKLQHRNLVKLLGYCIQGEEKILIYEYMLNKSLDYFIFDETRRKNLDWHTRVNIIDGIARGLLYLHQDSRLRIIHRDLKASNILLDAKLNPKISDFGLARTFYGDQFVAQTNRIAGTYGYMPPEYAMHGHFSMKSDVFSFGVIVLEVVSGRRSCGFSDPEHSISLPGYAWTLWNEGRSLKLVDEVLRDECSSSEVIRCIQVGLLCVQHRPEDRPDMSSVVLMLNGEKCLPKPKVPAFYNEKDATEENSLSGMAKLFSNNEISHTFLVAR